MLPTVLLLLSCRPDSSTPPDAEDPMPEEPEAAPWDDWPTQPLEGLYPLLQTELPQAQTPTTIHTIPERSLSIVWDPDASAVWILDARYQHTPDAHCVSTTEWPDLNDGTVYGCADDQIFTQRGMLTLPSGIQHVAVDVDGHQLALLDGAGAIWLANADPLKGNPLDYLRPDRTPANTAGHRIAFLDPDTLLTVETLDDGTDATAVVRLSDGQSTDAGTYPAAIEDVLIVDGVPWIRSVEGLYRDGVLLDGTADVADLTADGDGVAYTDPVAGVVGRLGADGAEWDRISVSGLHGPIAQDPVYDRLYVVTDDGIVVPGEDVPLLDGAPTGPEGAPDPIVDVAVNAAQEVLALSAGAVTVYGDDDLLAQRATADPVSLMIAAFVEKPRSTSNDAPCRGEQSLQEYATLAQSNAAFLTDLPAAVALGLTPHFARRAEECDVLDAVQPLLALRRAAVGVLYHEAHDCDPEADNATACAAAFFAAEAAEVADLGAPVTFSSGLSSQTGDWVAALQAAGAPERYLFFGMSILPDIPSEGDPRVKDSWPLRDRASLWQSDTVDTLETRGESGWLTFQPGDNLPAFNLSACANLFLRECHLANAGDGTAIDDTDAAVLVLLARRAVAEQDGPSAWSFHLPDLGVYDYTDHCTREDSGIWADATQDSGGDQTCDAARLQAWSKVMHTRYIAHGLARWAGPTDMEAP